MSRKAAETGPGAMSLVAMEQIKFPPSRRIIKDALAFRMLPFGMRTAIRLKAGPFSGDFIVAQVEKKVPGLWGSIMCRKRYIDDKVSEAVKSGEVEALVNLGAGFDTRAYRLPALAGIKVFELDQPVSIERKRRRLERIFGGVPDHVSLIPINFDREDPGQALQNSGWDLHTKTLFIWEGVTQYLSESGVRATFDFLSGASPGSRLLFTYIRRDFLEGQDLYGLDFLHGKMVQKGGIWLFGMNLEEVDGFLGGYGWGALDDLDYKDLADRYVKPTGRHLQTMSIERVVYAQKD